MRSPIERDLDRALACTACQAARGRWHGDAWLCDGCAPQPVVTMSADAAMRAIATLDAMLESREIFRVFRNRPGQIQEIAGAVAILAVFVSEAALALSLPVTPLIATTTDIVVSMSPATDPAEEMAAHVRSLPRGLAGDDRRRVAQGAARRLMQSLGAEPVDVLTALHAWDHLNDPPLGTQALMRIVSAASRDLNRGGRAA